MNSKTGKVYAVAMVIAMVMGTSFAINCYQCSDGKNCNDPFQKTGISNCTGKSCTKIKITAEGKNLNS